jgi:hypothetical protein
MAGARRPCFRGCKRSLCGAPADGRRSTTIRPSELGQQAQLSRLALALNSHGGCTPVLHPSVRGCKRSLRRKLPTAVSRQPSVRPSSQQTQLSRRGPAPALARAKPSLTAARRPCFRGCKRSLCGGSCRRPSLDNHPSVRARPASAAVAPWTCALSARAKPSWRVHAGFLSRGCSSGLCDASCRRPSLDNRPSELAANAAAKRSCRAVDQPSELALNRH